MLGLVALLILIAVPLYLWRRPKPAAIASAAKPEIEAAVVADAGAPPVVAPVASSGSSSPRLTLTSAKIVQCGMHGGRRSKDRCDELVAVAEVLTRTIRENVACAPASSQPYSVSFVLSIDFDRHRSHLWAGRSGTLRRRASADLIQCVERAIVLPDWGTIPHQFAAYQINVMAAYPATSGTPAPLGLPSRTSLVPPGGP